MKTITKILLTRTQISLLEFEDSNVLNTNSVDMKGIFLNYFKNAEQMSSSRRVYSLNDILTHEDLPSFLKKDVSLIHRRRINEIIDKFSNEKITPKNMKMLNLAYGLIEDIDDNDFDLDASFNSAFKYVLCNIYHIEQATAKSTLIKSKHKH